MRIWTYKNFVIHEFETLESTNKTAYEWALERKILSNEIVLAKTQTAGKGRMERAWISPQGNLYFSLVLRLAVTISQATELSFVVAVALRLALQRITKKSCQNKWPNDLLLDGKKLAGILLESKFLGNDCEFLVIGIGVNLVSNPDNVIFPATNLEGVILPPEMLKIFLDEFEKILALWTNFGFAKIRKLWLEKAYALGEKIKIKFGEENLEGIFMEIDEVGNLVINCDGVVKKVAVGDVS